MQPAIALLEVDSIAIGIEAGDAMAKRSPIDVLYAGTVHPGKFLVLVGGAVADVEEALSAGTEVAAGRILDSMLLPNVHADVVTVMRGVRPTMTGEALGVLETQTVASLIAAADAGLKGAHVQLLELRIADDIGGKAYLLFGGTVSDVEAAVEIGRSRIAAQDWVVVRVISQLHAEMRDNLQADARFHGRLSTHGEG